MSFNTLLPSKGIHKGLKKLNTDKPSRSTRTGEPGLIFQLVL